MEKLIFNNLTIKLKDKILFNNISFEINKGEKLMMLGKNGSGKSLLFELIAFGLTEDIKERYSGLEVEGEILNENNENYLDPKTKRNISYVSQNEEFYNNSTILDEAKISCLGSNIDFNEDYLDYLLKEFNLIEKKKQKIKNSVSFGEGKVIHLITRIMKLKNSNIFILDEPLNHLSFQNSKKFNDIMCKIIEYYPNLIILMISHCKAVTFIDKFMKYDYSNNKMIFERYKYIKCFEDNEY